MPSSNARATPRTGAWSLDVNLLGDAARIATELADVTLGERFARAAVERGGGLNAADPLARSLLWQARRGEVEQALADFSPDHLDEDGLLRWGATRICNFYPALGDAASGDEVLALPQDRTPCRHWLPSSRR